MRGWARPAKMEAATRKEPEPSGGSLRRGGAPDGSYYVTHRPDSHVDGVTSWSSLEPA
jgi:hypothetical protein